ncbi:hypothetical protein BCR34DRAFT_591997 [Clohesyomyces aquaticus]|uniref:Uncharacterized protein n=1 Tax=Clohesyomyces aquaticus TaxID=1231657 RepID=A0A1Y1YVU1_9PLEO|nr:hypothetical protein BCR34DRAFT_591997 [Clohesyomyces aquaticus]
MHINPPRREGCDERSGHFHEGKVGRNTDGSRTRTWRIGSALIGRIDLIYYGSHDLILGAGVQHKPSLRICSYSNPASSLKLPHRTNYPCGWAAYAVSTALDIFTRVKRLGSAPEISSLVVNCKSGYARENRSWFLSRLLRDLEKEAMIREEAVNKKATSIRGLNVTVLNTDRKAGEPEGAWRVALKAEKCTRRKKAGGVYALMRGNGHHHVFLIRNTSSEAVVLEDLASGVGAGRDAWYKKGGLILSAGSMIVWLGLITAFAAIQDGVERMLGVMLIDTFTNIITTAMPCTLEEHGIPLTREDIISSPNNVMGVLKQLEQAYQVPVRLWSRRAFLVHSV